jgi:hypothetical protein
MKWAIDVSGYDARRLNGSTYVYDLPMDWVKAREVGGLDLAIIKVSEGTGYQDQAFKMQWKAAQGVLPRAAYHFFRSNQNAIQQAADCWSYILAAGFSDKDFVILDYETLDGVDPATSLKYAASWLYEMEKHGVIPLIYTYPTFWRSVQGEAAAWAARYPLALAQWPKDVWILNYSPSIFNADKLAALKNDVASGALQPAPLRPWKGPAIWQFTARADTQAVPGHPAVKKVCDYDAIFMDLVQPSPAPLPQLATYRTLNILNARARADQTSPSVGQVPAGTLLLVDQEQPQNGYIHFIRNLYGPLEGWVWAAYTQKVP